VRRLALAAGLALTVLAFGSATRVADTREGLVFEVITLLGGLAGIGLLTYSFAARRRPSIPQAAPDRPVTESARPRSNRDLLMGAGGIVLGLILLVGLALSGGALWAGFGLALMLPMLAGSVYLFVRYLRASP
jgi:hypothetical protein